MSFFGRPGLPGASPFYDGTKWVFGPGLPPFNGEDRAPVKVFSIPFGSPLSSATAGSFDWITCTGSNGFPDLVRVDSDGHIGWHVPTPELTIAGTVWPDLVYDGTLLWLLENQDTVLYVRPFNPANLSLGFAVQVSNTIPSSCYRIVFSDFDDKLWTFDVTNVLRVDDTSTPFGTTTPVATSTGDAPAGLIYDNLTTYTDVTPRVWTVSLDSPGTSFVLDRIELVGPSVDASVTVNPFAGDTIFPNSIGLTTDSGLGFVWAVVSSSSGVKLYRVDADAATVSGSPVNLSSTLTVAYDVVGTGIGGAAIYVVGIRVGDGVPVIVQVDPTLLTIVQVFPIFSFNLTPSRLKVYTSASSLITTFSGGSIATMNNLFGLNIQANISSPGAPIFYDLRDAQDGVQKFVSTSITTNTAPDIALTSVFPASYQTRLWRITISLAWTGTGTIVAKLTSEDGVTPVALNFIGSIAPSSTSANHTAQILFHTEGLTGKYLAVTLDTSGTVGSFTINDETIVIEDLGDWP